MFFFFLKLEYTYQQRDATNGYWENLNMKLNLWFDVPVKKICVIISVAMGVFSERLTDTSCQNFFLWFLVFL